MCQIQQRHGRQWMQELCGWRVWRRDGIVSMHTMCSRSILYDGRSIGMCGLRDGNVRGDDGTDFVHIVWDWIIWSNIGTEQLCGLQLGIIQQRHGLQCMRELCGWRVWKRDGIISMHTMCSRSILYDGRSIGMCGLRDGNVRGDDGTDSVHIVWDWIIWSYIGTEQLCGLQLGIIQQRHGLQCMQELCGWRVWSGDGIISMHTMCSRSILYDGRSIGMCGLRDGNVLGDDGTDFVHIVWDWKIWSDIGIEQLCGLQLGIIQQRHGLQCMQELCGWRVWSGDGIISMH